MAVPMSAIILSACVCLSAALTIWSDAKGRRRLFRVSKPLTTVLIITAAIIAETPVPAAYKTLVLAGLLCSLAGDIALMFPEKWFTAGLVSFLAAHVFYILAFKPGPGQSISAGLLLPFVIFGLLMFRILAPSLGRLKIPVLVYIAAITAMAGLAAGRFVYRGGTRPLLAFAGAVLFLISDSVLAYDRFAKKLGPAQAIILGTYFPAQLLIALSI
jgi:uncharacterized membrane protein YhhN